MPTLPHPAAAAATARLCRSFEANITLHVLLSSMTTIVAQLYRCCCAAGLKMPLLSRMTLWLTHRPAMLCMQVACAPTSIDASSNVKWQATCRIQYDAKQLYMFRNMIKHLQ
jgi:hypothetical protein